jgi:hypothetical protein
MGLILEGSYAVYPLIRRHGHISNTLDYLKAEHQHCGSNHPSQAQLWPEYHLGQILAALSKPNDLPQLAPAARLEKAGNDK